MTDEPLSPTDARIIETLDRINALQRFSAAERIRCATEELRGLGDLLPTLLGLSIDQFPTDDGLPWGRIDPETGVWAEIDKAPLLRARVGPPPFYFTNGAGQFVQVVHRPVAGLEAPGDDPPLSASKLAARGFVRDLTRAKVRTRLGIELTQGFRIGSDTPSVAGIEPPAAPPGGSVPGESGDGAGGAVGASS